MLNEKERKMQSGLYSVLLLMLYVTHLERHKEAPSSGCVLEENGPSSVPPSNPQAVTLAAGRLRAQLLLCLAEKLFF